jgi:anti-anti-sigma regulatory factor
MNITRTDHDPDITLTVVGGIVDTAVDDLRRELLDVLAGPGRDVVLDVRQVDAFDEEGLTALTTARSRAKFARRRIVFVDHEDGVVTAALRRSGLNARFAIYLDEESAADGLSADRTTLARKFLLAAR